MKVVLKIGWVALFRAYELRKSVTEMLAATERSKAALMARIIFDAIIQEGREAIEVSISILQEHMCNGPKCIPFPSVIEIEIEM